MRLNTEYDVVLECNHPEEGSEVGYDLWARTITDQLDGPWRATRSSGHLTVARRIRALNKWDIPNTINTLLWLTQALLPDNVTIHIEGVKEEEDNDVQGI